LTSVEECLDLLVETIEKCNYTGKISIALDVAASGIKQLG
jgi:enolase